jgi:hypothetical protein
MVSGLLLVFTAVALGAGHGTAFDPNPLQDYCVADPTSKGSSSIYICALTLCNQFSTIASTATILHVCLLQCT